MDEWNIHKQGGGGTGKSCRCRDAIALKIDSCPVWLRTYSCITPASHARTQTKSTQNNRICVNTPTVTGPIVTWNFTKTAVLWTWAATHWPAQQQYPISIYFSLLLHLNPGEITTTNLHTFRPNILWWEPPQGLVKHWKKLLMRLPQCSPSLFLHIPRLWLLLMSAPAWCHTVPPINTYNSLERSFIWPLFARGTPLVAQKYRN